jgi:hydrogenase maturation protein HypF
MALFAPPLRRVRLRIEGTVQGVGFRPYVHRLAGELGLAGWVGNDERGVLAEVEGEPAAVEAFVARLPAEAPPLARVGRVRRAELEARGERGFAIAASASRPGHAPPVTPDTATCADCLAELFDPTDRRHRYPFVNCTNCGPRFTIVTAVPYDRPRTTMAGFQMCEPCRAEYEDPGDRRFHAQPNACPACGPRARLLGDPDAEDPIAAAAAALHGGEILAVKGIGGYHLACVAGDEAAVGRLRARKHREDRPFALLVRDLDGARELIEVDDAEAELLGSPARPIVLAPRRPLAPVAVAVAPRARELGVMLPYSPLHHLLAADAGVPRVLTSGNVSDEPIAHDDADALERLAPIADAFLVHDRPIHTRVDDSVVRRGAVLRRSRGMVPEELRLPVPAQRPLLACGAELKSTFCLARGSRAWVSHHVGDLGNAATLASFETGAAHFERLFAVAPEVVVVDLHPDYLSTRYALDRADEQDLGILRVQHHHAHLAACLAEHGEMGPAVGAIYDGSGLGTDGTVWGGEILAGDLTGFERAGHLLPVPLPGGDRAVRQPWRMACAWLGEALGAPPPLPPALAGRVDSATWRAVAQLARTGLASPVTTSAGRLFDAVAALCGLRTEVTYEGQAAIELEAACDPLEQGAYEMPVDGGVLDGRPLVLAVARDVEHGVPAGIVAARFHHALADATAVACAAAANARGIGTAVLSGGAFQNARLLDRTATRLRDAGLRVLVPRCLPANDGGIAYGQAVVAAAQEATA